MGSHALYASPHEMDKMPVLGILSTYCRKPSLDDAYGSFVEANGRRSGRPKTEIFGQKISWEHRANCSNR